MSVAGRFSWSERKRRENLRKHGIDFRDVASVFDGPSIDAYHADHPEPEERWRRLVWLDGRVIVVVYTEAGDQAA
jgi:hypothetical protein